jgi:hypothetical protein
VQTLEDDSISEVLVETRFFSFPELLSNKPYNQMSWKPPRFNMTKTYEARRSLRD